jgi:hypothetical protein
MARRGRRKGGDIRQASFGGTAMQTHERDQHVTLLNDLSRTQLDFYQLWVSACAAMAEEVMEFWGTSPKGSAEFLYGRPAPFGEQRPH